MKARGWSVLFTGTASGHVDVIAEWWVANRRTVPCGMPLEERLPSSVEQLSIVGFAAPG